MIDDNTLKEFAIANPHLVTMRPSARYSNYFVVKYKNKVFYDNLWTPELQEMRGLVVDKDWNVVVRPFTKIFNRFENGTDLPLNKPVMHVRKINGFMAAMTYHWNSSIPIVSTTGSLDSPFVELAEKHLLNINHHKEMFCGVTYLFEIVDQSDPHIIDEESGAYLIGARTVHSGVYSTQRDLDYGAKILGVKRPEWGFATFGQVVNMTKTCKHEGYVVHDTLIDNEKMIMKIKSPHYLIKKFLSRVRPEKLTPEWISNNMQNFDEEFYPLLNNIREMGEVFTAMDQEGRKIVIENYLNKAD